MVRPKHPLRAIAFWALAGAIVFGVLTFYLWHINENIRLGLETSRIQRELRFLREDVDKLQTRKTALLALDRVEQIARRDLKMTDPRDDQFVFEDFEP